MDKYTITDPITQEQFESMTRREMALIHEVETLWFDQPDLTLGQVATAVASALPLRDLIILATAYLAHFVRGGDEIS